MWLGRLVSIPTHCYKRCDFLLIGCCELSLTSTFIFTLRRHYSQQQPGQP